MTQDKPAIGFSKHYVQFQAIFIWRALLFSFSHVMKRVALDLVADKRRFRLVNQLFRVLQVLISWQMGSMDGPDQRTVLSSAYVTSLVPAVEAGIFDIQRLNKVGDKMLPWGTTWFICIGLDFASSVRRFILRFWTACFLS